MKLIGRGWWIRTTESSANGFTVRPLWPLGNPSKSSLFCYYIKSYLYMQCKIYIWSWWRESNPQPADYKSAALPLSHASKLNSSSVLIKLAIRNGLEPSTSSVTGWHSNQLNYRTASLITRPLFQPNVKPIMVGVIGLEPMTLCL